MWVSNLEKLIIANLLLNKCFFVWGRLLNLSFFLKLVRCFFFFLFFKFKIICILFLHFVSFYILDHFVEILVDVCFFSLGFNNFLVDFLKNFLFLFFCVKPLCKPLFEPVKRQKLWDFINEPANYLKGDDDYALDLVSWPENQDEDTKHYNLTKSHTEILHTDDFFVEAALAIILCGVDVENIVLVNKVLDGEIKTSKKSN